MDTKVYEERLDEYSSFPDSASQDTSYQHHQKLSMTNAMDRAVIYSQDTVGAGGSVRRPTACTHCHSAKRKVSSICLALSTLPLYCCYSAIDMRKILVVVVRRKVWTVPHTADREARHNIASMVRQHTA
jgi:hypothetical protein